ncbi:MAG: glycosyltransferase [Desulfobacteraceae bacterium]|nr:glycosyltransferase [Desulfobacteraceae bacterium]
MTPPPPARPIKVLHLGSPGPLYGAERWILALVRHLDPARIYSIVAAVKDEPGLEVPLCHEAERYGIETHIFEAYGRFNFSAVRQLRKFISEHHIQILHTHFYKTDLLGLLATWRTKCKIISTPHGWSKHMDFKLWCYEMLDRGLFTLMDGVAPLSEELCLPLIKLPGLASKLHFIKNGVDVTEIDHAIEIHPDILKWKATGAFVIGYIGQLISRKGLDVLFSALTRISQLDWRLFIVGDGEAKAPLEALAQEMSIADKVIFTGFSSDRLAYLKGLDIFALPSRLEGIPRCLMEAMAAGVPVIASDIPGCNDLIKPGETGFLFPPGNHVLLADAIVEMYQNTPLREAMARKARDLINEQFSAKRMVQEYQWLYEMFK